nr:DUF4249 domain-containing protein [uncultured Pedobacter sp.]
MKITNLYGVIINKANILEPKYIVLYLSFLLSFTACRDSFNPQITTPLTGYLVVEGSINTNGITQIKLSRTRSFQETKSPFELGATVQIAGKDNTVYHVAEKGNGIYESDNLTLPSQQYRLKITTADGKQYESNFEEEKVSPLIDSLSYVKESDGVRIYVNTHDDTGKSRYYQWSYDETWEIRSLIPVSYKFVVTGVNPNNVTLYKAVPLSQQETDQLYYCWKYNSSKQILLGSSVKLVKDVISYPIAFIPNSDERFGVLYSINVKQQALNVNTYNFMLNLKSNTESNGSIFDRQPSETQGNIICISNPQEQVIGNISVGNIQQKRIFIPSFSGATYRFKCSSNTFKISNIPDTVYKYAGAYTPVNLAYAPITGQLIGYDLIDNDCVTCTMRGNNVKPPYWP